MESLKFASKRPPPRPTAPKRDPDTPPPAASKRGKGLPHKAVKVRRIADYLGVDIRVIHGYIRRGSIKGFYPPGTRGKHVYADEAQAIVRKTSVRRGGAQHTVRKGLLMSWDKGGGSRQVAYTSSTKELTAELERANGVPMIALLEDLERDFQTGRRVIEEPEGVVRLLVAYLRLSRPDAMEAIEHLRQAALKLQEVK